MADIERELDRLHESIRDGFDGLHTRLDVLNGRTRDNEKAIAVLQDRSANTKDTAARWTGGLAIAGGVIAETLHRLWGAK